MQVTKSKQKWRWFIGLIFILRDLPQNFEMMHNQRERACGWAHKLCIHNCLHWKRWRHQCWPLIALVITLQKICFAWFLCQVAHWTPSTSSLTYRHTDWCSASLQCGRTADRKTLAQIDRQTVRKTQDWPPYLYEASSLQRLCLSMQCNWPIPAAGH